MQAICCGPSADDDKSQRMIAALKDAYNELQSADQITNFFGNLPSLFVEKAEDVSDPLNAHGLFLKLSFSGVAKLQKDYMSWCSGDITAGYEPVVKDQQRNIESQIFKTQADKKSWAKPDAFEAWEKGHATGDENVATENLRRFFDQHFHENNDSGVRQHALLNLARMHYLRHEITAARTFVMEAITVSRTCGDKNTLQHCISLLHRLPSTTLGGKPTLNELQSDLHPLEVLFDVKKLMDTENDQPLSEAFVKLEQAIGLYDYRLDVQNAPLIDEEQWAHHAVQSVVWDAIGCGQLAFVEESIVLAFTKPATSDPNRITMFLNRAYQRARQGSYSEALAMLLEPDVWRGLTINDYATWAHEIWQILALRATRRGQDRLYQEFLLPRRPPGDFNSRAYAHDAPSTLADKIRDPLYEIIQMRVITGNDIEQRAFACFTLARCLIASNGPSGIKEALHYLTMAESDYETLQIVASLLHVQYLLSVVYHNLGMREERDAAARRHIETLELHRKQGVVVVEDDTRRVLEVVELVGAQLAGQVGNFDAI
ncbi:hypothetical protein H0H92_002655 [Tricholoma furcatifolium]|nr:hypothetical protein H0H92_002655 [Tricholoma furcatifolium]